MMKVLTAVLVVLATSFVPGGLAAAGAAPPATVTIESARQGPAGTFDASGAISDSGTFEVRDPVFGGPGPGSFVTVKAVEVFTGADGTFTITRMVRVIWGDDPSVRDIDGTWAVTDGTGAYEDLHARGTIAGTVQGAPPAEQFVLTYVGTAHTTG